jgi:predicted ATPase
VARAVRALLERVAAERPVALLLDDVHWADPASAEVLALLLHRPPRAGVLMALAARAERAAWLESARPRWSSAARRRRSSLARCRWRS